MCLQRERGVWYAMEQALLPSAPKQSASTTTNVAATCQIQRILQLASDVIIDLVTDGMGRNRLATG